MLSTLATARLTTLLLIISTIGLSQNVSAAEFDKSPTRRERWTAPPRRKHSLSADQQGLLADMKKSEEASIEVVRRSTSEMIKSARRDAAAQVEQSRHIIQESHHHKEEVQRLREETYRLRDEERRQRQAERERHRASFEYGQMT